MTWFQTVLADLSNTGALWEEQETHGTTVTDASGHGHTGTIVGTVTLGATNLIPSDPTTTSFRFFGGLTPNTNYFTFTGISVGANGYSIELALSMGAVQGGNIYNCVISSADGNDALLVHWTGASWSITVFIDGLAHDGIATILPDGSSHHIVLTVAPDGAIKTYVDGILDINVVGTYFNATYVESGNDAFIDPLQGNTAGLSLNPGVVLSQTQVTAHYNSWLTAVSPTKILQDILIL